MSRLSLGSLLGVPLRVHWSFLLLPAFLLWRTGSGLGIAIALAELGLLVALFACVVLHELGHALAARRYGVGTRSITLYPFGGVAELHGEPPSGRAEAAIAAAGPAVNLLLAGALALLAPLLAGFGSQAAVVGRWLVWINLAVAAFNLIPGFPLDGGRALRGLLSRPLGDLRATVWAASVGQILAVVMIGVGLFHEPWLALGGVILLPAANVELRGALKRRAFASSGVRSVMSTRPVEVTPATTLGELEGTLHGRPTSDFVVRLESGYAWLPATRVWRALVDSEGSARAVGEVASPLSLELVDDTPLADADAALDGAGADAAAVVDARGKLVGVITSDRIRVALKLRRTLGPDRPLTPDDPG